MRKRYFGSFLILVVLTLAFFITSTWTTTSADHHKNKIVTLTTANGAEVSGSTHAVSDEVKNMPNRQNPQGEEKRNERAPKPLPLNSQSNKPDSAVQSSTSGPHVATTAGLNFAGVGQGDYGFSDDAAPPDTNGAVGATQYVQWVNESFAVFDKTSGALLKGPVAGNTLFSALGGQ